MAENIHVLQIRGESTREDVHLLWEDSVNNRSACSQVVMKPARHLVRASCLRIKPQALLRYNNDEIFQGVRCYITNDVCATFGVHEGLSR